MKKKKSPLEIFLDGLDASVDGRGYGKEHEHAKLLLEAAPELLEAAKETILELHELYDRVKHVGPFGDKYNKLAAAIAKAEGRE